MAKHLISLRVDVETLGWFRRQFAKGYQTKMNYVLNDYRSDFELKAQLLVERAQQIYLRFHSRCFWHLKKDLRITVSLIPMVQAGLRKYGGAEGYRLASEIELRDKAENSHAD